MKFVLPLLLIGSGAWAECPTAADLAQGIRLRWSDGAETVVRATNDPSVLAIRHHDDELDGPVIDSVAWGLYQFASDRGLGSVDYGVEPRRLPRPAPDTEVNFPEVRYWSHFIFAQGETYQMGPLGRVSLAGCSYRAFEVARVGAPLALSEGHFIPDRLSPPRIGQGWAYLADLGFAVTSWFGPPEERTLAPDVVAIEAVQ